MSKRSANQFSKVQTAARELRRRVTEGIYRPHGALPSERELAHELGVGRPTVRAAIEILIGERLLQRSRGLSTRVLPPMERFRSKVIGIVRARQPKFPRMYESVVAGIEEELMRQGYEYEQVPAVMPDPRDSHKLIPTSADILAARYGALAFAEIGAYRADVVVELERRKKPLVVADMEYDIPVSGTWTDHAKASLAAVRMLAALGHRRIGFIMSRPLGSTAYERARLGYIEGLREAGLPVNDALILITKETDALSSQGDPFGPQPKQYLVNRHQGRSGSRCGFRDLPL